MTVTITRDASTRVKKPTEETTEILIKRIPVTQEFLAVAVAAQAKGVRVPHPACDCFSKALFDSIHKMVYKQAEKYKRSCHEDADDLAQDCFRRIMQSIPRYNPKLAKFSTWVWKVCSSVLNSKYRRNMQRMQNNVRPYDGFEARSLVCDDTVFTIDFTDALRDLKVAYPKRAKLIHEIFGDPDSSGFVAGSAAGMKVAAEKAGMEYAKAYYFYSKVVKPFMKKRLEGYSGDEEGNGGEND